MRIADLHIRVSTKEQIKQGYLQRDEQGRLKRYCEFNYIAIRKVIHKDHCSKTINHPAWGLLVLFHTLEKRTNTFIISSAILTRKLNIPTNGTF